MSNILSNDNSLLQGLLNKIVLYRFTRNLDKELRDREINHSQISLATGRSGNWFNRTFNEIEDMRISTLIKLTAAVSKIIAEKGKYKPIPMTALITEEILEIASVSYDLMDVEISEVLNSDPKMIEFFPKLKFYVDSLKTFKKSSHEETEAFYRVLELINKMEE